MKTGASRRMVNKKNISSNTEAIVTAQPLIAWSILSDVFMRWMRYDGSETDDSIEADDWDEQSAAGSVQGLYLTFAAWREIHANMDTVEDPLVSSLWDLLIFFCLDFLIHRIPYSLEQQGYLYLAEALS